MVVAYTNKYGYTLVTPYRKEIPDILRRNGYVEKYIYVPFSNNGEKIPNSYLWLMKIAKEENSAATCVEALKFAKEIGISDVNTTPFSIRIKEVKETFEMEENIFLPMTGLFLLNGKENVGTYIVVNREKVLLCDEYGRTFLVSVRPIINEFVNALIDAGYTRTCHPENYVKKKEFVK